MAKDKEHTHKDNTKDEEHTHKDNTKDKEQMHKDDSKDKEQMHKDNSKEQMHKDNTKDKQRQRQYKHSKGVILFKCDIKILPPKTLEHEDEYEYYESMLENTISKDS